MAEPKLKLSTEEKTEILSLAVQAHENTGGAPVEVTDSSFKVKIGAWPDAYGRKTITDLARSITMYVIEKTSIVNKQDKN